MLFDAHNHLHDAWLAPHRDRVLADLAAIGTRACVVNGTNESDWPAVTALCDSVSQPSTLNSQLRLLPSFGLHPWHVGNATPDWPKNLLATLDAFSSPVGLPAGGPVKVGEIGLDRWILDRARPDDPRLAGLRRAPIDEQLEAFHFQLSLAAARNLPCTIHCIDAYGLLHDTLRAAARPARGFLLHAYAGSLELMRSFADLGAYFSFNGYFLDPRRAARLRPVYAAVPADRLLVETDAPAMPLPRDSATHHLPRSPEGAVINHPANLEAAYAALAAWRGLPVSDLAAQISENFARLFLA